MVIAIIVWNPTFVSKSAGIFLQFYAHYFQTQFYSRTGLRKKDGGLVSGQNGQNFAADLSSIVVWPGDLVFFIIFLSLVFLLFLKKKSPSLLSAYAGPIYVYLT